MGMSSSSRCGWAPRTDTFPSRTRLPGGCGIVLCILEGRCVEENLERSTTERVLLTSYIRVARPGRCRSDAVIGGSC